MLKERPSCKPVSIARWSLGVGLLVGFVGCTSNDLGNAITQLAPADQMFTTYGGNTKVSVPITYRDGINSFAKREQTWHFKYFGSWDKALADPGGWSMFIPAKGKLEPGEVKTVVNGKPVICGNKANDALHPMHDFYFVLSSNRLGLRNAKPSDFGCTKTYQDIWNYIDNAPGLKSGQTVLHTYCMTEFHGGLSRAGFSPTGPFKCRFILDNYKQGSEHKADIQLTVYTETDSPNKNADGTHLNIFMNEVGVEFL
jgi:hypothetical protein